MNSNVNYKPRIPEEEYLHSGHLACPGCGASLSMRYALKALGKNTMIIIPACCWSIIAGAFPYSSLDVPVFHTAFETAASVASGMATALERKGEDDVTVMAWAGDGGTFDIGFQAISGAAERNSNIIYVCYDNEAYMNTGIQRSSATPYGAWTTTTPEGSLKERPKKNIMDIMVAHKIPYAATACVAYPEDMIAKLQKAKDIKGMRFIHLLSPCPPGWKTPPDQSIKLSRMAVNSKVFPLYEVENGKYRITVEPSGIPVDGYIKAQGRFKGMSDEDIKNIQKSVDENWEILKRKAQGSVI